MEVDNGISCCNKKIPLENSTPVNESKNPGENHISTSMFVNHAAISWHESRRKWIGDLSTKPERVPKDPIISWSTTYEDLLSTNEPFHEPIPLPVTRDGYMQWNGVARKIEFTASSETPFEVDGSKGGLLKNHGPLSFIRDAGKVDTYRALLLNVRSTFFNVIIDFGFNHTLKGKLFVYVCISHNHSDLICNITVV